MQSCLERPLVRREELIVSNSGRFTQQAEPLVEAKARAEIREEARVEARVKMTAEKGAEKLGKLREDTRVKANTEVKVIA